MNIQDYLKKTPLHSQWQSIGIKSHHGIAVPLGGLRSEAGCGVGEFHDLYLLIDFCKEVGFDLIQLLPLNDSGDDPSPYNALSSYALHPIYLSLKYLPFLEKEPHLLQEIESLKQLNSSFRIEYSLVLEKKLLFLKRYVELTRHLFIEDKTYLKFLKEQSWLEDYALYKTIKHSISFLPWNEWPDDLKEPTPSLKERLKREFPASIQFYSILQFLCFSQLSQVKEYAQSRSLFLMGDIPILISPDSADVWAEREFFDMNYSVGFPPDVYSKEGQLWGFPALRWDKLAASNYSWWKKRLDSASSFYHLYRIDHVAGFYRLWLIERGKKPKDGAFFPSDIPTCVDEGHRHLSKIIQFSSMLPIAEDLGLIPEPMSVSLKKLGIPGTKVMRWERAWSQDGRFTVVEEYPLLSMTCVSTHDSDTLSLWWKNFPQEAKEFCQEKGWTYSDQLNSYQREQILKDSHRSHSLFHINLLGEYLGLFPELCHLDPQDERINVPGIISSKNWTYRMQVNLELLKAHQELKKKLIEILKDHGV